MIFSLALAANDFYMRNLRHHITRLTAESAYKWLLLRAEVLLTLLLCSFFSQGNTITIDGNLNISSNYTINETDTLIVNGNVSVTNGTILINGTLNVKGGNITLNASSGDIDFTINGTVIVSDRRGSGDNTIILENTGNFNIQYVGKSNGVTINLNGGKLYVYNDFNQIEQGNNSNKERNTFITTAEGSYICIGGDYSINDSKHNSIITDGPGNATVYVLGEVSGLNGNEADGGIKDLDDFINDTGYSSIFGILPIELTSFTVSATKYGYTFNWVTTSEIENDYFTLECSEDGEEFIAIDYVHGAGTTSETTEYKYVWERKPKNETLYFRLKQTDYNGKYSYSDIIVYAPAKTSGATRSLRYGPLNLQVVDGQLRYIVK